MNRRILLTIKHSFGLKVLSSFVAVIVVSLTIFTVVSAVREGDKAKRRLVEKGDLFAGLLSNGSVVGIFAENAGLLRDAAAGILGQKDVLSVSMYNADRKLLFAEGGTALGKGTRPLPKKSINWPRGTTSREIVETEDAFAFLTPVVSKSLPGADESVYIGNAGPQTGRVIGYVQIVLSKGSYRKEIASLVARNIVMMLVFIVTSGVIVWFAVKQVMRPLNKLTENVKALEKGMPVEPIPVESGDEIGKLALAFNTMVVARSRVEESLHESEERYRKLVELSPDAIYVQQGGKIAFINAAGAKLFGASGQSEVLGRPVSDLTHEDNDRIIRKLFVQSEEEDMAFSLLKIRYRRLDGTAVDAEAAIAPMQFQGARAALVIARDVSERKGMEEMIRLYQQELYSVASEMSSLESRVEERERNLIAADLHDYVGQNLVVLQFKLGALRKLLKAPELTRHLEEIREIIGQTIAYTRSLTVELSPPILVEIGLKAALESLAEGFRKNHGILVSVTDDGLLKEIDDDTRYLLFRCVRELLMNVVKHARASNVSISLEKFGDQMHITVVDNGIGFDAVAAIRTNEGFGLFTIRERMKRVGGSCEIETEPGSGTKVTLLAPLRH